MQLRRLVLETSARKMLFPARDVSGLGEDVQVGAKATRNDRHLLAPVQGIEKQTNIFHSCSYLHGQFTIVILVQISEFCRFTFGLISRWQP